MKVDSYLLHLQIITLNGLSFPSISFVVLYLIDSDKDMRIITNMRILNLKFCIFYIQWLRCYSPYSSCFWVFSLFLLYVSIFYPVFLLSDMSKFKKISLEFHLILYLLGVLNILIMRFIRIHTSFFHL